VNGNEVALAAHKAGDPTGVRFRSARRALSSGKVPRGAADCMACHTSQVEGLRRGLGIRYRFGALYSTNITPDKETGIGNYSDQDFLKAVQRGIRRDGHAFIRRCRSLRIPI